ncbi:MAG: hypothetical protein A2W03_05760 [Candidatus Aminicenantes bacterium RBG_16_63_16]|nr:MAG: hypothetical protein A2W03_05760 [Candidatus Aminicenantes bacterium RBG_16_63_16]
MHKSLGLTALLDQVRGDRSYSILDLGPAREANVLFWSQFSCWLHILDFYRSYREGQAAVAPEKESEGAAFSALLPFSDETVFDIILAWDLFNYLDLRELEALVQRLGRWCRPGTRLFALISSLPEIPASPTVFRILNREQLTHEIPTRDKRPGPRHQPRDIVRLMARFTVSSSFLMRHGIQEYVFEFK